MRKILIMILIIIFVAVFGIMVTSGITLGAFEIPAIEKIVNDNKELDNKIAELSSSLDNDYKSALTNLDSSLRKEQASKQKYQDTITYSTEEEIKAASQLEKYEISFLWTKIGLYATEHNVTIKANVSSASIVDLYNISFEATGTYIDITEFVEEIEKDSKLGFKIEDFGLVQYSEEANQLQATFSIRNIAINKDTLKDNGNVVTTTQDVANGTTNPDGTTPQGTQPTNDNQNPQG